MYAELVVQTERNLPRDLAASLREQWGPGADVPAAVALSALNDSHGWASSLVRYAQITSSAVYLVFTPDTRTIKLHVESTVQNNHLRLLRGLVDDETRRMRTLLARHDNPACSFTAHLYTENAHLQTGSMFTRAGRIVEEVRTNVVSNLYVPVSAFVLSLMMDYDVRQALYNVAAALLALFVWVVGAAVFTKAGYHYREEA